ncbi:MAG: glycosyltransferase family 4 protein [Phycisphaeraceae bacterium]
MNQKHLAILCGVLDEGNPVSDQVIDLANQLADQGYRVSLLALAKIHAEIDPRITVFIKGPRPRRLWLGMIRFQRWIDRQIETLKPDHTISTLSSVSASIMVPMTGTKRGRARARRRLHPGPVTRFLMRLQSLRVDRLVMNLLERRAMSSNSISCFVALTPLIELDLKAYAPHSSQPIQAASIREMDRPTDPTLSNKIRQQFARAFNISHESYWIIHPFVDIQLDGFETAIRAFAPLIKQGGDVTLLLAGPTRYTHLAWIGELGLREHVRFIGKTQHMQQLMAACDLVLNPTVHDPLGAHVREAIRAGKPVITTHGSGAADLVPPNTCTLLPAATDPAEVLEAIRKHHAQWQENPEQSAPIASKPPSKPSLGQIIAQIVQETAPEA